MEIEKSKFQKYLFVCENKRENGEDCCGETGMRLRQRLKEVIKQKELSQKIRVSRAGCLDVCSEGPSVLLMPDNIWFKRVSEKDLKQIVDKAIMGIL